MIITGSWEYFSERRKEWRGAKLERRREREKLGNWWMCLLFAASSREGIPPGVREVGAGERYWFNLLAE